MERSLKVDAAEGRVSYRKHKFIILKTKKDNLQEKREMIRSLQMEINSEWVIWGSPIARPGSEFMV